MKYVNSGVYRIVYESEDVDNIMVDLLLEIPQLFETLNFNAVKDVVVNFICDPKPFTNDSSVIEVFEKILKKHLDKGDRFKTKKSEEVKMADKLRTLARLAMKGECKDKKFLKLLGCKQEEFRIYMEELFDEGMSWDNYGIDGWHIDHIEPLCSFDLKDPKQVQKSTHYSNLRPLWATDNMEKGNSSDRKKSIRK